MGKAQKTALVLGATGLTGGFCLQYLLESECYGRVIGLGNQIVDIKHPKLTQIAVDFYNTAAMEAYYIGVDDVFCCLGTTVKDAGGQSAFRRVDFHIPTEAANMASGHGVKQFLAISSSGADNRSSDFYLRVKGELEKGIAQFNFKAIHLFRPSGLIGPNGEEEGNSAENGKLINRLLSPFMSKESSRGKPIEASLVATAMVNAAQLDATGENFYGTNQIKRLASRKVPCETIGE